MNTPNSKILFVDDEPLILETLQLVFRDWHIKLAVGPEEALKAIQSESFAVIVSDQRMPGMSGTELLKKVKEISPETIRIVLTGYSELDLVIDAINSGEVWRFINKPWDNDKLKGTVKAAYDLFEVNKVLREEVKKNKGTSTKSTNTNLPVLFIDQLESHLKGYEGLLSNKYQFNSSTTLEAATAILKENKIAILACDSTLASEKGTDFLTYVRTYFPDIISIYISDSKDSVEAIRLINESQVFRYLVKPFPKQALIDVMEEASLKYEEKGNTKSVSETKKEPVAFSKMLEEIQAKRSQNREY
ncbi:MAG: response regulator [Chloroherpetonaceae bacterium]|nr:response regulator [Chloroherpetonaceae bacterium]